MNYKNKLNQIKALLALEVKLAQMKLEDGITIVEAEAFEPDYSIGIVTADGIVPLPIGEYKLEDGSILSVEVEGIIASITPASEAETETEVEINVEAAPEDVVEPMMEAEVSAPSPKRIVESVSKETFFAEIEQLKTELAAIKAENEALKSEKSSLEVELSNVEAGAEAIMTNPEAEVKTSSFKLSKNRARSIEDSVFSKIFNK